ncbi:MAG: transglutaminase family protein [Stellaceae bacterium]|jgi:transglutaminase-like putative cysteine protease
MSKRHLVVNHVTTYRYSEPVAFGEHRMMFRPRDSHDLRLLKTGLEIRPEPATLSWLHDVFDNSVAIATFDEEPASELRFESRLSLEHFEVAEPDYALEARAKTYPFAYSEDELPNLGQALRRHHPSPEIDSWMLQFLDAGKTTDTMELLRRVILAVKERFVYEGRTEKGVQSPDETLRRGRGSCRDFALLMMEGVRSLGLAARFVSGYIFVPGDGTVGGGSTHAWMQVYLPGAGWVDFDPTNSAVGNRNLIRVAVAWDPAQALPLWGTFFGYRSSFRSMEVSVNVTEERA